MPALPCQACRTTFETASEFRDHYKSPFHKYNLQRKLVNLAPISYDEFQLRTSAPGVNGAKQASSNAPDDGRPRKFIFTCSECGRKYKSKNAFLSHSASCRGTPIVTVEVVKTAAERRREREEQREPPVVLQATDCLFCNASFETVEENVAHMKAAHGFSVADEDKVDDMKGLLQYLGAKMGILNICLWCCTERVDRMRNADRRRLPGPGVFYSLADVREHMLHKCPAPQRPAMYYGDEDAHEQYAVFYTPEIDDEYPSDEDGEWEDVSDESELEDAVVDPATMELVLPDKRVGHRALRRYYKQKLRPNPHTVEDVDLFLESSNAHKLSIRDPRPSAGRHAAETALILRKNVGAGTVGAALPAPRAPLVQDYRDYELKEERRKREELKIDMKNNNQKHFRPQVIF